MTQMPAAPPPAGSADDPAASPVPSGLVAPGPPVPRPAAGPRRPAGGPTSGSAAGPPSPAPSGSGETLDLTATGARWGDRIFSGAATSSGALVVAMVVGVGVFLLWQAVPSLQSNTASFLTDRVWSPGGTSPAFGVPDLLYTTVLSSVLALALAVPVAVGIALFTTQYAPRRVARPVAYMVDLLAAVPSIIYGLWGIVVLAPILGAEDSPVRQTIETLFGWIPIFRPTTFTAGNVFVASVVLAIMILPIIAALSREVFAKTPTFHQEAAYALGATKWEMIRIAVLPFGRPGLISAAMLGLGRALGETIAVTIILYIPNANQPFDLSVFFGGQTFASKIANSAGEFDTPAKTGAYIAAGLVLFVLTFAVNAVARSVINRRKEFVE